MLFDSKDLTKDLKKILKTLVYGTHQNKWKKKKKKTNISNFAYQTGILAYIINL